MIEHHVSGLAVLNDAGEIVANISASDIRELGILLFIIIYTCYFDDCFPLSSFILFLIVF